MSENGERRPPRRGPHGPGPRIAEKPKDFKKAMFRLIAFIKPYLALVIVALVFAVGGHVWAAVLPQVYLVLHIRAWRRMVRIRRGRGLNAVLGLTGRNILLFSLLLSAGFLLGAAGRGL